MTPISARAVTRRLPRRRGTGPVGALLHAGTLAVRPAGRSTPAHGCGRPGPCGRRRLRTGGAVSRRRRRSPTTSRTRSRTLFGGARAAGRAGAVRAGRARRSPWWSCSTSRSPSRSPTTSPRPALGARGAAARVGAVEPGALEHDADRAEQLADAALALGALGEGVVGERLVHLEPVVAGGAGVGVRRHGGLLRVCRSGRAPDVAGPGGPGTPVARVPMLTRAGRSLFLSRTRRPGPGHPATGTGRPGLGSAAAPLRQPALLAQHVQPLLGDGPHRAGATTISSSPRRRRVPGWGTNAVPSRTTSVTFAPCGSRSSKTSMPCSRDSGPTAPAARRRPSPRAASTRPRGRCGGVARPARACGPPSGSVGACTRVKTTTSTKTRSKSPAVPGAASCTGTVASTIGTAPRRPGPGQEHLLAPGQPEPAHRRQHRQRPGHQQQHQRR